MRWIHIQICFLILHSAYSLGRRELLAKAKKYLTNKSLSNDALTEKEHKLSRRRFELEQNRRDLLSMLNRLDREKELMMLKPLLTHLEAYHEYFTQGKRIFDAIQPQMDRLRRHIDHYDALLETRRAQETFQPLSEEELPAVIAVTTSAVAASPMPHSSQTISVPKRRQSLFGHMRSLSAALGSSQPAAIASIRDLDAARGGQIASTSTNRSGFLYLATPAFAPVFCVLADGSLTISRLTDCDRPQIDAKQKPQVIDVS